MVRFTPRELPTFVSGTAQSIEYYIRTLARLLFGYHETSPIKQTSPHWRQLRAERWQVGAKHSCGGWEEDGKDDRKQNTMVALLYRLLLLSMYLICLKCTRC